MKRWALSGIACLAANLVWLAAAPAQDDPQVVDPIHFRELLVFAKDLNGWTAQAEPKGQTVTMGDFKITTVERSYTSDGKTLKVTLLDGALNPLAYSNFKMLGAFQMESTEEFTRSITFNEFPAIEHYEYKRKRGQLMILVGERILVTLEGRLVEGIELLKEAAKQLDLAGMAALLK